MRQAPLRRCVFLDRDGVINRKAPPHEYIRKWKDFHFIPAVVDWIRIFNALGFLVIVATNQRGVALGRIDPQELSRIHENMRKSLLVRGARIDDIFCCPHDTGCCECRKPKPGMVLQAAAKWRISIPDSILIGDSPSDQELAVRCGLHFVGVADGRVIDGFHDKSASTPERL
jgi:D-glycero-D-manno-heptose 1,7-bisphosphate phosphatase